MCWLNNNNLFYVSTHPVHWAKGIVLSGFPSVCICTVRTFMCLCMPELWRSHLACHRFLVMQCFDAVVWVPWRASSLLQIVSIITLCRFLWSISGITGWPWWTRKMVTELYVWCVCIFVSLFRFMVCYVYFEVLLTVYPGIYNSNSITTATV